MGLNYKEYENIQTECMELAIKKNNDYGCNSLKRYGNKGLLIRLADKTDRLSNLICGKVDQKVVDEKLEDTLLDIINYATYMIMQLREKLDDGEN